MTSEYESQKRDNNREAKRAMRLAPQGATAFIDGMYYKVGLYGYAYMLIDDNWYKSGKSAEDVKNACFGNSQRRQLYR